MTAITEDEESPIFNYTGRIRSIRIGHDYKDAMVFNVGKSISFYVDSVKKTVTITKITEDAHDKVYFGIKRYNIFAKGQKTGREMIWKHFDNMPCIIEYFDEDGEDSV